ncbi:NAD(P)H-dependent oxidoreductase [Sandaracinobacter sp. RS1-74]|uniref:NAD(P)H-dependent oxidoreductase n=1 Tax=Sandaracinobacteroides sayramensis TaxID=2913411 RepID=UPI001EDA6E59|nr:NAD(P)H-dependent oxidoreductase [Sandaracinobacteroides sayramensis]MCG2842493.1 NAD(P)H-dependent oxidoreductase [Sandaracinobacteroides sayramensis]
MHVLVVVSHPVAGSLTQAVARRIAADIEAEGHTIELADLATEGFDPRFGATDIAVHTDGAAPPPDVLAEQGRLDRADALVLVYPIYWWSMPALLKGWIDRVFITGWAYADGRDGRLEKKLGRLQVHLVALGGAGLRTYARRGYFGAMKLQIDQGIFDYCGAPVKTSELLVPGDTDTPEDHLRRAREIALRVGDP